MGTNGDTKMLLFKALSSCFPYGVMAIPNQGVGFNASEVTAISNDITGIKVTLDGSLVLPINMVKPYLRPLSSMTEEEWRECVNLGIGDEFEDSYGEHRHLLPSHRLYDWLNAHYFDYRGLIPKGLAISTEEFNTYKD